jgi:hypothetical protein
MAVLRRMIVGGALFSSACFFDPSGANSDAAKLSTPSGLAVEACSELREILRAERRAAARWL